MVFKVNWGFKGFLCVTSPWVNNNVQQGNDKLNGALWITQSKNEMNRALGHLCAHIG